MRPIDHVISAGIYVIPYYSLTNSLKYTALFAVAAVAMDIDHAIDYILWNKRPLSIARFFERGSLLKGSYLVFFLHGYEWMLLLYILSWWTNSPEIFAITNGFFMHLMIDEIGNRLPSAPNRINIPFYFFTYRLFRGFRVENMYKTKTIT
ncbi:MAG: hypothetical protein HY754_02880 [Nitrospirae bacterium]|nr:hypothetical protein [Nitrospirota bacterium]